MKLYRIAEGNIRWEKCTAGTATSGPSVCANFSEVESEIPDLVQEFAKVVKVDIRIKRTWINSKQSWISCCPPRETHLNTGNALQEG